MRAVFYCSIHLSIQSFFSQTIKIRLPGLSIALSYYRHRSCYLVNLNTKFWGSNLELGAQWAMFSLLICYTSLTLLYIPASKHMWLRKQNLITSTNGNPSTIWILPGFLQANKGGGAKAMLGIMESGYTKVAMRRMNLLSLNRKAIRIQPMVPAQLCSHNQVPLKRQPYLWTSW